MIKSKKKFNKSKKLNRRKKIKDKNIKKIKKNLKPQKISTNRKNSFFFKKWEHLEKKNFLCQNKKKYFLSLAN